MGKEPGGRAGDAWGGFAAMLVALPAAIAYGVTVFKVVGPGYEGVGALAGILGTIALGLLAPTFGGSTFLVSSPCGPAALLLAEFARRSLQGSAGVPGLPGEKVLLLLTLVAFLSAVFQILYGVLGGGRLIKYIPYPVVAGYLSGIGILLFTKQIPDLFGLARGVEAAQGIVRPSLWAPASVVVCGVTVAGMLLGPRITRKVPAVIIGLAAGIAAFAVVGLFVPELAVAGNRFVVGGNASSAGEVAGAFANRWRSVGSAGIPDLALAIVPAITLSVLLSVDTLKTCVVVDALTRTRHDSNRELRGQGIGNLASAVLGGMPGAGTMGGTQVNIISGGRTRMSGTFAGLFALAAFVLFGGFLPGLPNLVGWIPKAALAGIIMVVSYRMVDRHSLDLLRHRSTALDFVVVSAVVVTAVVVDPIAASGVGLGLAIMLFIREQIRGSVVRLKVAGNRVSSKRQRPAAQAAALQERGGSATLCELQGTLFFGTTDQLFTILEQDLKTCRYLILDLRRVQALDFTAAHMLAQIESMLTDRGAYLLFAHLPAMLPTGQDLKVYFDQLGLVKRDRNVRVFDEADDAIEWVEDRILDEAGLGEDLSAPALGLGDFDLFKELPEGSLAHLAKVVEERSVKAGEAVFARGAVGDEVFLIRRGRVEILLPLEGGRRHHLATFSRQSFFGDLAFLDRRIRSADAIAAKETDLFVLSRARFDALSREYPSLGAVFFARLARILAHRLRQTDAELQALEEA